MKEIIFYGDDAFFYDFPNDIDIYYGKPPLPRINDDASAIRSAIQNPIKSPNLEKLIDSNSTVAICFDDISVPLPPMKNDIRKTAAEVVLTLIKDIGVEDENINFICATGLHRKCKSVEIKHLLGKEIYKRHKNQICNHDAEDKNNLTTIGKTSEGDKIELNKLAVESDLIIYLNVSFVPLNGGWKSIIVGLGSYNTIIPHHSPEKLKIASFMDPSSSELHKIIWEMGNTIKTKISIFTIEMVINNKFYSGIYKKIYSPLKEKNLQIPLWRRLIFSFFKILPKSVKAYVRKNLKAGYELIDVFAGDIEETHKKSLELMNEQLNVEVSKKYDAIIFGVPNLSPYNVGSEMNPLLLHTLVSGYLFNMHQDESPFKKDGTLIILNPANGSFDCQQHPSYKDFFYNILPQNPDIFNLKSVEEDYINNNEFIKKYRNEYAYHPVHAPIVYYWGIRGILNIAKIIVAGAKNQNVLDILGYEYAENLDDALAQVKDIYSEKCSIAYFCIPPLFITKFTPK